MWNGIYFTDVHFLLSRLPNPTAQGNGMGCPAGSQTLDQSTARTPALPQASQLSESKA